MKSPARILFVTALFLSLANVGHAEAVKKPEPVTGFQVFVELAKKIHRNAVKPAYRAWADSEFIQSVSRNVVEPVLDGPMGEIPVNAWRDITTLGGDLIDTLSLEHYANIKNANDMLFEMRRAPVMPGSARGQVTEATPAAKAPAAVASEPEKVIPETADLNLPSAAPARNAASAPADSNGSSAQ